MPRKVGPVLSEMMAAIEGIERSTLGKSFEDFRREWLLKHGVQRGIEINLRRHATFRSAYAALIRRFRGSASLA